MSWSIQNEIVKQVERENRKYMAEKPNLGIPQITLPVVKWGIVMDSIIETKEMIAASEKAEKLLEKNRVGKYKNHRESWFINLLKSLPA